MYISTTISLSYDDMLNSRASECLWRFASGEFRPRLASIFRHFGLLRPVDIESLREWLTIYAVVLSLSESRIGEESPLIRTGHKSFSGTFTAAEYTDVVAGDELKRCLDRDSVQELIARHITPGNYQMEVEHRHAWGPDVEREALFQAGVWIKQDRFMLSDVVAADGRDELSEWVQELDPADSFVSGREITRHENRIALRDYGARRDTLHSISCVRGDFYVHVAPRFSVDRLSTGFVISVRESCITHSVQQLIDRAHLVGEVVGMTFFEGYLNVEYAGEPPEQSVLSGIFSRAFTLE